MNNFHYQFFLEMIRIEKHFHFQHNVNIVICNRSEGESKRAERTILHCRELASVRSLDKAFCSERQVEQKKKKADFRLRSTNYAQLSNK